MCIWYITRIKYTLYRNVSTGKKEWRVDGGLNVECVYLLYMCIYSIWMKSPFRLLAIVVWIGFGIQFSPSAGLCSSSVFFFFKNIEVVGY